MACRILGPVMPLMLDIPDIFLVVVSSFIWFPFMYRDITKLPQLEWKSFEEMFLVVLLLLVRLLSTAIRQK